jgi:uncharacterized protein YdaU (DUF1376 family)
VKKPSHIPLFPDSYHRDTTHLTTEEHGAYFLLLMAAWGSDDCTLPNDEKRLAALAKLPVAKWRKIAPTVLEFWTIDKGRIHQKRLLKEWHYVRETRSKRKAAADTRWGNTEQSKCNANAYSNGMHLGGGEGGGGLSSERDRGGSARLEDDGNPFRVVNGGSND